MNICKPILKVLRLVDREGTTMGLFSQCTQRMLEKIKKSKDIDQIMLDKIVGMCIYRMAMLHSPLHAVDRFLLHPI